MTLAVCREELAHERLPRADLLVVDGDPLADIRVLQDTSKLVLIMRDGAAFKYALGARPRQPA